MARRYTDESLPQGLTRLAEDAMSNFDRRVYEETITTLRQGPYCAGYPSGGFYGTVWDDPACCLFKCQVKRSRTHIGIVEAATPQELMDAVCERYGYE